MNDHDQHCKSPWKDTHPADECVECLTIADVRRDERRRVEAERAAKFGVWHDYQPEMP